MQIKGIVFLQTEISPRMTNDIALFLSTTEPKNKSRAATLLLSERPPMKDAFSPPNMVPAPSAQGDLVSLCPEDDEYNE